MSVTDRIARIFREALAIDVAEPTTDLVDSGLLDSLALVTLLFEVEQEFSITLPLDDVDSLRSVERIAALVEDATTPPVGRGRVAALGFRTGAL